MDINKSFLAKDGSLKKVFSDLSLQLRGDVFFTLIGPNGCGKSTLLNLIARLLKPDSGTIEVRPAGNERLQVGYCWQDYRASLLPWMNVVDNITFPLRLRGVDRKKRYEIGKKLIDDFMPGVNPNRRCFELSGGQQQLINLLRSATVARDVYLLDEPFSALDQQRRWTMALYVERIWRERKVPTLFSSHDVDEAVLLADEILLMSQRGTVQRGLVNNLPRPRSIKMLTSSEHIRCREAVIEFLLGEGAGSDISTS